MNNAIILSQICGPLLVLLGLSMILNRKWYMKLFKEMQDSSLTIYALSIISFIFGLYTLIHFSGSSNIYEIIATFIGITVTLKSVFYILAPQVMKKITKQMKPILKHIHYIGVIYFLVGIFISYVAFI